MAKRTSKTPNDGSLTERQFAMRMRAMQRERSGFEAEYSALERAIAAEQEVDSRSLLPEVEM